MGLKQRRDLRRCQFPDAPQLLQDGLGGGGTRDWGNPETANATRCPEWWHAVGEAGPAASCAGCPNPQLRTAQPREPTGAWLPKAALSPSRKSP